MQLTGPFRKGRYRPDKGSVARSYQNPSLAGQAFLMLFAQRERREKMVVEGELGREGKLNQGGGGGQELTRASPLRREV